MTIRIKIVRERSPHAHDELRQCNVFGAIAQWSELLFWVAKDEGYLF